MLSTPAVDVATLCHWVANVGNVQADIPIHSAYHYGSPCPYRVVAEVLAGRPDPREQVTEWRMKLPFDEGKPPLSLNDRYSHYMVKAKRIDTVKKAVRRAVTDADVPHLPFVHVEMRYRPATNRFRDIDNLVATLKPIIDGLHQPDAHSGYAPVVDGDDPRYVSWSQPILVPPVRPANPATWLILRSYDDPATFRPRGLVTEPPQQLELASS